MQVEDFLRIFPDVEISAEQLAYCRYLEGKGQRFLIDFGYENAFDKAFADLESVQ